MFTNEEIIPTLNSLKEVIQKLKSYDDGKISLEEMKTIDGDLNFHDFRTETVGALTNLQYSLKTLTVPAAVATGPFDMFSSMLNEQNKPNVIEKLPAQIEESLARIQKFSHLLAKPQRDTDRVICDNAIEKLQTLQKGLLTEKKLDNSSNSKPSL